MYVIMNDRVPGAVIPASTYFMNQSILLSEVGINNSACSSHHYGVFNSYNTEYSIHIVPSTPPGVVCRVPDLQVLWAPVFAKKVR